MADFGGNSVIEQRALACAQQAVERVELSVELSAADMDRVVIAMAEMFVIGWHASGDTPGRALVDGPRRSVCFGSTPALGSGRKGRKR